ncbi:MAG: response regulator transcription factor [Haliea sp.]|nr:MAG: response regulator transcription factor [Haliea sp.]
MRQPVRVGIADDHIIVRSGLRDYFSDQPDIRVVGEASDGRAAIDLVRHTPMDVLVLDIAMPGHSGVDAIGMVRAKAPQVGVLMLSSHPVDTYALKLLRLGAHGYLDKQCDPEEILQAVRSIGRGQRYIQPELADLLARQADKPQGAQPHAALSDKEFQVFIKLAQGARPGQVAEHVSLSPKTVSSYRCKILDKLGLSTNSELTHYALRHRLID